MKLSNLFTPTLKSKASAPLRQTAVATAANRGAVSKPNRSPYQADESFMAYAPFRTAVLRDAGITRIDSRTDRRVFQLWTLMSSQRGVPSKQRVQTATRLLRKQNRVIEKQLEIRKNVAKRAGLKVKESRKGRKWSVRPASKAKTARTPKVKVTKVAKRKKVSKTTKRQNPKKKSVPKVKKAKKQIQRKAKQAGKKNKKTPKNKRTTKGK